MKYKIERNRDKDGDIIHMGKVTSPHGFRQDYTFAISYYHHHDGDDTGIEIDSACEWFIEFGQEGLPSFFCRSDHKTTKRIIVAIIIAFENGRDIGETN